MAPNIKALLSVNIEIKTIMLGNRNILKLCGIQIIGYQTKYSQNKLILREKVSYMIFLVSNCPIFCVDK